MYATTTQAYASSLQQHSQSKHFFLHHSQSCLKNSSLTSTLSYTHVQIFTKFFSFKGIGGLFVVFSNYNTHFALTSFTKHTIQYLLIQLRHHISNRFFKDFSGLFRTSKTFQDFQAIFSNTVSI